MKNKDNFKIIDINYLYSVSQNNDFIKKIFSLFKKEIHTIKNNLPKFLKEKNFEEMAELIHKAKSNISILGMNKQAENLKILEKDIRYLSNTETYSKRISDFISDCEQAVSEIEILEKTL